MPASLFLLLAAALGLCFGSFANVVVCRLANANGESVLSPPSHCLGCGYRLKWRDMIPLLSWFFLRGRCRYCQVAISKRYPMIEAACAVLFVLLAKHTGYVVYVVPLWCLAFILLCIAVIDWDTMLIPDSLLVCAAVSGVAWLLLATSAPLWSDAFLGMAAAALFLLLLNFITWIAAGKPGFGLGDVKLMAVAGLFLGWQGMPAAFFFAFVSGGAYGALLLLMKKAERGGYLPFAPFLCAGVLLALLYRREFFYVGL